MLQAYFKTLLLIAKLFMQLLVMMIVDLSRGKMFPSFIAYL